MANTRSPRQYTGVRAVRPPDLTIAERAPTGSDTAFLPGQLWLDKAHDVSYQYSGTTWIALGSGTTGAITTITGDSGGAKGPSAGNFSLLGTANQITVTGGANKETFSIPAAFTAPGSITATTTITATLGAITATNGNLVLGTAGNKIIIPTGADASVGTSSAMSGTPGAVTVATTACSATAKVFYSRKTTGGTPGQVSITAQDGTGFTLTSTANETSTFNWWIINS